MISRQEVWELHIPLCENCYPSSGRDSSAASHVLQCHTGLLAAASVLLSSRDRFRTMTNVLGDALAAGIIQHVCEKDFAPKPPKVRPVGSLGAWGTLRPCRHKERGWLRN